MPDRLTISLDKVSGLRYGENPHQSGALYAPSGSALAGIAGATQLHGRELSYNNLMDADAAWRTVSDFAEPTVAVVKHNNPCGLASRDVVAEHTSKHTKAIQSALSRHRGSQPHR